MNAIAEEAETRDWDVWSMCVMGTHYHLLVSTPDASLAAGLHRAHSVHARRRNGFDRKRRGAVFGRRYYAVPIRDARHYFHVIRYIALNPVKARLCRDPADWSAGTYRALAGYDAPPRWLAIDRVYRAVGKSGPRRFREWVTARDPLVIPPVSAADWTRYDIWELADQGVETGEIASRLGITERHVRRLLLIPPFVDVGMALDYPDSAW